MSVVTNHSVIIDSHCHFDFAPFAENPHQAWTQAQQAGVKAMVIPTVGRSNWQTVSALCQQFSGLYYGLGIHPFFNHQHSSEVVAELTAQLAEAKEDDRCVAVGECGLDFAVAGAQREQQLEWLRAQLQLANSYKLPVILHCRKAFPELMQLLRQHPPMAGGVYHGFSGSYQQATQLVDLGIKIGVGGTITYSRAQKTRATVAKLPLSALLLETDAPDMPVAGYQGQPNRPERLVDIAMVLAEIRAEDYAQVAQVTTLTTAELFQIKL
ncbi:TatD family hydrolase [Photobacterium kishitanii]|uniref:TatD family hydrolase n=1 Tax=Photobacterium kishitanii TaxID=318456 RepID=UPI000AF9C8EB|nr:TatD family hydrolase [Photobacterium kishitanii]